MINASAITDANNKGQMGQPEASIIANTRGFSCLRKGETLALSLVEGKDRWMYQAHVRQRIGRSSGDYPHKLWITLWMNMGRLAYLLETPEPQAAAQKTGEKFPFKIQQVKKLLISH
jgi:hypothetical protein